MEENNSYISSASIKERGRTAYSQTRYRNNFYMKGEALMYAYGEDGGFVLNIVSHAL